MSNLDANLRSETSKGNNNILRKQGMVPGVLYGGEEKNELIKKRIFELREEKAKLDNELWQNQREIYNLNNN